MSVRTAAILVLLVVQVRAPRSDARQHFDDGLTWLHNFGYDEAIDEFQQAQALSPTFVMAFWGEALCHYRPVWRIENVAAGRAALAKLAPTAAERLARAANPRERAYLQAAEALFASTGAQETRHAAFAEAMRSIAQQFPDDLDAPVFYAFSLIGLVPVGQYDDPKLERAGAAAEAVFARNPKHPGAAHAIIHAYDDRERAPRALAAAKAYAGLARASSHARHMPAHIFVQLGMWNEAVAADESAWEAARAHGTARRLSASQLDYHPLSWLLYEYIQQGRFDPARNALTTLERAVTQDPGPAMVNELATWRAFYIVGSERWSEVADRQKFDNADELFTIGYASAKSKALDRARATLDIMKKVAATEPEPSRRQLAIIMQNQLDAAIKAASGALDSALASARMASELEDRAPRSTGRPHPVKSSHELYGELLLEARRPAEARVEFERALWRAANRSSAVLGLARAAAAAGEQGAARRAYQQFLRNWSGADPSRPELAEARRGAK